MICNQVEIATDSRGLPIVENACECCATDIIGFLDDEPEPYYPAQIESLIAKTTQLLTKARLPLICGLSDQSVQTQQAAIALAKRCDAAIDWTSGNWPFAFQQAIQDTGWVSCSYDEIRDRADLVIQWACDPKTSHPFFADRFIEGTDSIPIDWDRKKQTECLRFLRQQPANETNAEFVQLKQRIDEANYPVIIVDDTVSQVLGETGLLSLFRFVRRQNDRNHCRIVYLSEQQNSAGIRLAMSSMTGAPFGVTFRDGQPMFRGREFSSESLLRKDLVDVLLLIGSPQQLPQSFRAAIPDSTRTIWICDQSDLAFNPEIKIQVSRWGLSCNGTGIRDDGVSIDRPAIFQSILPTAASVLDRIVS